jgi:hypothetical protein
MKATQDIIKAVNRIKNDKELGEYVREYLIGQELSAGELKFYPHSGVWYNTETKETGMMRGKMD